MKISEKLTQQQIVEVLVNVYKNEGKLGNLKAKDLIIELKQQITSLISK